MANIPERLRYLLDDDTKAFLYLATLMPDGTPQVTPIWFDFDGEHIRINSARGRVKDRNMRARRHVAALIQDPNDIYSYLQVRGAVVEITEEGGDDHIRDLALKYRGKREYDVGDDIRVTYKIAPEHIFPRS